MKGTLRDQALPCKATLSKTKS